MSGRQGACETDVMAGDRTAQADLTVRLPGGAAMFTTREHGNLSLVAGDGHERGRENQERLRHELGLSGLARGYQVHGTRVLHATDPTDSHAHQEGLKRADGQATNAHGLGAMVLTADCLPVILACEGAVAALHAGWRGLAAGVLEEGLSVLRELDPQGSIVAVIGPGAGPCCYEVGPEVHSAFDSAHRHGRHIDLKAIAREHLYAAGVQHVRDLRICTICDERFYSHRRESTRAGRQAGITWLV